MRASELMTPNVRTCGPNDTVHDAAQQLVEEDCGSLPVVESGKVVGILTDRDITVRVVATGKNPKSTRVRDCMTDPVTTCSADEDLESVLKRMRERQVRRLPVVDAGGRLLGIIATADVLLKTERGEKTLETISQPTHATTKSHG